jgi:hypothetical protein
MSEQLTIDKLMSLMPKAFVPEKAGDLEAVIQFNLSGEGGGDWAVTISEGSCSVSRELAGQATLSAGQRLPGHHHRQGQCHVRLCRGQGQAQGRSGVGHEADDLL